MYIFKFSDIGEGIHEGIIGEIFVKENQLVKEGENLFLVETDKITTEITSPVDGVIKKILIKNNDLVKVGQELFYIEENNSDNTTTKNEDSKVVNEPKEITKEKEEVGSSVIGEVKVSNTLISSFGDQNNKELNQSSSINSNENKIETTPQKTNFLISPIARMIASESNLNLNLIKPTGPNQRILRIDVENYLKNNNLGNTSLSGNTSNTLKKPIASDQIFNITSLRKAIATNLKKSTDNVSYTNLTFKIDVTSLWAERNKIKDNFLTKYNLKLSIFPFIIKAIALALVDFPLFNAIYDEKNQQIILKGEINIGIAINTKEGLIVPNIKNVNNLSILEIAKSVNDLVTKAKNKTLSANDYNNGTFSITNYGSIGALSGVPIIKYPELAIAGIGTIYEELKSENNQLVNKSFFNLTIAADHKWIDGGDIANFSLSVKKYLENILLFLF